MGGRGAAEIEDAGRQGDSGRKSGLGSTSIVLRSSSPPTGGAAGTVRQSVESYLGGELRGAAPCKESEEHHKHGHHH